jgi:hypothetical protein
MVMLRMFDDAERDDRTIITQREFNAGDAYFQQLKSYGRSYLESSGFEFIALQGNKSIQGLLNHAVQHHNKSFSAVDNALAFGAGMAT